jgi:hypothetical protein
VDIGVFASNNAMQHWHCTTAWHGLSDREVPVSGSRFVQKYNTLSTWDASSIYKGECMVDVVRSRRNEVLRFWHHFTGTRRRGNTGAEAVSLRNEYLHTALPSPVHEALHPDAWTNNTLPVIFTRLTHSTQLKTMRPRCTKRLI